MNENEEQIILDIKVNYDDAITKIADYRVKIDGLTEAKKSLEKENEKLAKSEGDDSAQIMENQKQIEAINAQLKQEKDAVRELSKEVQNGLKQDKEKEGSLRGLRAELSNTTKEYDALSRAEREGAKGKELASKINNITTELKEAEAATQRYYRNVGNYENAIQNALGANSKWFQGLQALSGGMQGGFKNAVTGATQAVSAFGKQLLALLANPIVATLAAIAGAFMLLSKAIKSDEESQQRLNAILAPFNRILQYGIKILQEFAGKILSVVEAGGKLLAWAASMIEKLPIIGDHMKAVNDELRASIELEQMKYEIEKASRTNEVQNAKDALEVAKLRNMVKDTEHYTAQQRLQMLTRANALEEQQMKRNVELAKQKLKVLQAQAAMTNNDKAVNDALAQAEAAVYNAEREYYQGTIRLQAQMQQTRNEILNAGKKTAVASTRSIKTAANDRQQAIKDAAEKERNAVRQAEDALLALLEDSVEKQRKTIELQYTRQIEDLRKSLTTEKNLTEKAREAINQTITALEQKKVQELQRLSDEEIKTRIETEQRIITNTLAAVQKGSDEELELKRQQIANEEALEVAQAEKEVTDAEERERLLLSIHEKYNAERERIDKEARNAQIEQATKEIEIRYKTSIEQAGNNELEVMRLNIEMRKALLDAAQQQEGESIEAFNLRKLEMENAYQQAKQELADKEVQVEQGKFQAMAGIANGVGQIFEAMGEDNEEFAKLSKILALAEIAINTGKAISAGVAQAQSVPYPANLTAIATTVATILANIATAIKTVKSAKFAEGGTVFGAGSGTSDSIHARLSNGESVNTAQATSLFSPLLSALNQLGGGVPIVATSPQQQIGEDMLANAFARGAAMMPRPVVSVEEINTTNERVQVIERLSSVG